MNAKQEFAESVLKILEEDDEWSSETLDHIAEVAELLGLAQHDGQAEFKRTKDGET